MADTLLPKPAHIIVLGNEKGGSGKSTVAMHVAVGLLRLGFKVATIDLDSQLNGLGDCIWVWFKSSNHFLGKFLLNELLNIPQHLVFIYTNQRYSDSI